MAKSVLIIDDEASIREALQGALGDEGYRTETASSGREGLSLFERGQPDLVLLDIWMPEMDGLETLIQLKKSHPQCTVIMMSGHGNIETAVKAIKHGAYDFIEKPLSLERLLVLIQNASSAQDLVRENQALRQHVRKTRALIGRSTQIEEVRALIRQVAPTTGSVLITGENGTGKELVAQSIHALSPRFNKPFIEVNCAAIPDELIESELFGHEKGAFTGAERMKRGKFDLANGGTIFLDEIGDMSLKTQAKILRILQEQKFERVGSTETISVDARVVAATNKDLRVAIQKGEFREDLFYRLNVIRIHLPPLRERKIDIAMMTEHFVEEFAAAHAKKPRKFSEEAMDALVSYEWPGNVRELRNLVERIMILTSEADDGKIIPASVIFHYLKDEVTGPRIIADPEIAEKVASSGRNLRDARQEFEREFIVKTLKENDWNISRAAAVMGIERSYLHKKIKTFGIEEK